MPTISAQIRALRASGHPAGFVPIPLTARLVYRFQCQGKILVNVYHIGIGPAPAQSQLQAAADGAADAWATHLAGSTSSETSLIDTTATSIEAANGGFAISLNHAGTPGTSADPPMPVSVCAVVSFRTGLTGKSNRGRTYISPVANTITTSVGSDQVSGAWRTANNTAWEGYLAAMTSLGAPLKVASRQTNPGTAHVITAAITQSKLGSQRRRLA